ncbi:MAG TPA: type I restriction enzyme HsdR N-terminal domain-containing protein [Thermodesulfobacteriota bacterium]|nr:type I restriction enzyme HsdR N-terminal domain-containing protein [Thermodesulfobacteriota bacterium]
MNEYEVAMEKVLPFIRNNLRWPEQLISAYGRVPVQIGGSTVWADFVYYISKNQKAVPWLLVEVKQPGAPLEQAFPQAESYSLILGARFFCVTDGEKFEFYMTENSQGKSINLQNSPPIPSSEYLEVGVEYISFPPQVDNLVELFLVGLKEEDKFLYDTEYHREATKQLHEKVFQRIDSLSPEELKDTFKRYMMMKPPNKNQMFKQIDEDFGKLKEVLKFTRDFAGDPVININRLMDRNGNFYLKGGGIFFITQLLAGAHPNEYVVLEDNVSRALRYLGVTDILVKNDTANGYVYINEICKKLFKDKLEQRLKDKNYDFGLVALHNFLWHYYVHYRITKKWFP